MQTTLTISADEAERASIACVAAARERSLSISVAVVDSAGQTLRLQRMDGAKGFTADLALRKARTATTVGVPTAALAASLNGRPLHSAELIAVGGGAPVLVDGSCAGGIGISGASPEQDEAILKSGLDALAGLGAGKG
jgi:uncharacterized protein GlcG (DUF336 family)